MQIGFYLMTEKGFEVLKAVLDNGHKEMIAYVCVGSDKNIQNDFSDSIQGLCIREGILMFERTDTLLSQKACDFKLAVSWRWLIKSDPMKLIVLHDSLLPRLRGFSPLVTALINQDKAVGVTAIFAENDFDRGPIILQKKLELTYPIKIAKVIELIAPLYAEIVLEILKSLRSSNALKSTIQNEDSATYSLWRDEADYQINWELNVDCVLAKINASGYPYAGAATFLDGSQIRILDASAVGDVHIENRVCGKVLFVQDGKPVVVCGKGLLKIEQAVFDNGDSALPFKNFRTRLKSN